MNCIWHRRLLKTLLTLSFLLWVSTSAFADPAPESVVLDSLTATNTFAQQQIARLRVGGISRVELFHVGSTIPDQLNALAQSLSQAGIHVSFRHVDLAELDRYIEAIGSETAQASLAAFSMANYVASGEGRRPLGTASPGLFRESLARLRSFFGIPNGMSWLLYRQDRPNTERAIEVGSGLIRASFTTIALHYTLLAAEQIHHEHLNHTLPLLFNAAGTFAFAYFQRGNSMFLGQGRNFDFEQSSAYMNRKFFLFMTFLHSIFLRQGTVALAHVTDAGFTMGWDHFISALATSGIGLVAKSPVEMYLRNHMGSHSRWWFTGWMTAWGTIYSSLQILDLFHIGAPFRWTFVGLGAVGLVMQLRSERAHLYQGWERLLARLTGRYRTEGCRTLLVGSRAPIPPIE